MPDHVSLSCHASSTPIKRWYDNDLFVGNLVYSMQEMSPDSQGFFARLLKFFIDDAVVRMGGREHFLKNLEWERITNLRKSRRKRRWYDQTPLLYRTFRKFYALNEEYRQQVAHQLFIPSQLVYKYELFCRHEQKLPDPVIIEQIVETCIRRGPETAMKLYGVYLDYFAEETPA